MLQSVSIRRQIEVYTSNGNKYLSKAVELGNRDNYVRAIQEFVTSYKFALLLNSQDGMDQLCAFNLGAAHVAGGDVERGINLLQTLLENSVPSQVYENTHSSDSKKGDIYYNLAIGHEKLNDVDNAVKYYQHALLEYRDDKKDRQKISETHLKLANINNHRKEFSEAHRNFSKAAAFYEKQNEQENEILALICQANAAVSDPALSRDECNRLLDVCFEKCKKLKHANFEGKILCEVGLLYSALGRPNHALICFEKSVGISNKRTNPQRQAIALQNAGAILNTMGYFAEAILRHTESAKLHGILGNRNAQGQSFCNLAFAHSQLKNYEESWEAYLHALQAFKDTGDKQGQWQCHEALGAIAFNIGRTEKAVQHFKLALTSADKHKERESHDRIVSKLTNVLETKAGSKVAHNLQLAIENRPQNENSLQLENAIVIGPVDYDADMDKRYTKKSSRSKHRRKTQLERGKRMYSDKNDQPVVHIARGISNITQTSNPFAERQDNEDSPSSSSSSSNGVFGWEKLSRSTSSDDSTDSSDDDEKKRVLGKNDKSITRKKQLQGFVQVTTVPISSLTSTQDDDQTQKSGQNRRTVTPDSVSGQEESVESTPRTASSSVENMSQVYKDQLDKIEEEEFTDVTSQSSSSSSESEDESGNEKFVTSSPVKPKKKQPDRLRVAYVNDENVLYTKSMKQTEKPNESNSGFRGDQSTHIYESIKTAKVDEPNAQTSQDGRTPDKNDTESKSSADDAPPLSSLYQERNTDEVELDLNSENSSKDPDEPSETPEPHIHHVVDMQNRSLPSPGKAGKKKKKNDDSRACVIM